jgi:Fe-S cluster assembly protein SufD
MNAATTVREHYLSEYARIEAALPGRRLPWLARLREEALAVFAETALPTTRQEDWKYTSVAPLDKGRFMTARANSRPDPTVLAAVEAQRLPATHLLVFVNGYHQPQLSRAGALPAGATLGSIGETLTNAPQRLEPWLAQAHAEPREHARAHYASGFAALNAAFAGDGAYIHLSPGVVLEAPVHLLFVAGDAESALHPRNLIVAEDGSRVSIVEHYVAADSLRYFTNVHTDIHVGRGAEVEHHRLQQESRQAFHVGAVHVAQAAGSRFTSNALAFGAALARLDLDVGLQAEQAECTLNGLYQVGGRQHVDHHTRVDHAMPRGVSRELYKGVLADSARAVFNGKVIVHPDAQHSDAQQANRNLLLSDEAEVDSKPELEIYADDVKCTHGATVGQLDAEQLFYLRSRGVDAMAARALLTFAFADEIVRRVSIAPLRERLEKLLLGRPLELLNIETSGRNIT